MQDLNLPKRRTAIMPAPILKRIAAFFIDIMIIGLIVWPITGAMQSIGPKITSLEDYARLINESDGLPDSFSILSAIMFVIIFVYFLWFEYAARQTPGKMVLNLYVAPVEGPAGNRLSLMRTALRSIGWIPFLILPFILIIDPFALLFTGKRLSDMISGSTVVEEITI